MEFGLINLNRLASDHCYYKRDHSFEKRRQFADDDENINANTHRAGSNTHRPSASTSNSRTGMLGDYRTRSTASLTKSISFETPYGVVRQSSSSTLEPETIHSVTSQESFRRDISLYKMQLMPALAEDGDIDLSDEDGKNEVDIHNMRKFTRKGRNSQKGKTKSTKNRCPEELEEIEIEQDGFDNIDIDSNENESDIQQREVCGRKLNKGKLIERVMKLFSCAGRQNKDTFDLDGEMLIHKEAHESPEESNDKHGDKK